MIFVGYVAHNVKIALGIDVQIDLEMSAAGGHPAICLQTRPQPARLCRMSKDASI
jgi:hypothetical protein